MKRTIELIKRHGFSLVEAMVAAGLLGAMALGGMRIVDFQTTRTRDTSKNFQADNIMYDLMYALRDRDSCFETFKSDHTSGASLTKIVRKDETGAVIDFLKKGNEYGSLANESGVGKVKIKEMRLSDVDPIGGSAIIKGANLIITFEKKGAGGSKDAETVRILPIKFIFEGGIFSRCVSENSNNLEDLCSALGGVLDVSDNDLCKSINIKTFTMDNSTAMGGTPPPRPYAIKAEGAMDVHGKLTFKHSGGGADVIIEDGKIENVTKLFVKGPAFANEVSATKYNHVSDQREKKNIRVISEADASKILKLRGVSFKWKESGEKSLGLVAQEVQKLYPELVGETKSGLTIEYANLLAPMLEVIKRQEKQIRENQKEIDRIERSLSSINKGDKE